jgi:glycerate dehydrogenase
VSVKERVVFLDRAALTADELPIPNFEHNWSEYPDTEAADIVPRLFWATTAITHATPIDAEAIRQLHKLTRIVVTGPAVVDAAAGEARGIAVQHLPVSSTPGVTLIDLLEALVERVRP